MQLGVNHYQTRLFGSGTRSWRLEAGYRNRRPSGDPKLSAAKRLQRTQALNSSLSHANLEQLETKKRKKELLIERLERDRRYFADREMGNVKRRNGIRPSTQGTNSSDDSPPSVPISVIQTLTNLRPAYADLLEEHGATAASLRQRFAEFLSFVSQNARHQKKKTIQALGGEARAAKEDARRIDSRVMLVEREVEYLQALLASFKIHLRTSTGYRDNGWNQGENEALIKQLKELEESMVLSNTTSQTGRRAGAAGLWQSVLRPSMIPSLSSWLLSNPRPTMPGRMPGRLPVYAGQRIALAAFHYVTKSPSATQSLPGIPVRLWTPATSSLRLKGGSLRLRVRRPTHAASIGLHLPKPDAHRVVLVDLALTELIVLHSGILAIGGSISDRALENRAWKQPLARRQHKDAKLGKVVGGVHLNGIGHEENSLQHTLSIDQHLCPISRLQVFEPRYSYAPGTLRPLMISNRRKNRIDLYVPSPEEWTPQVLCSSNGRGREDEEDKAWVVNHCAAVIVVILL
ncbi:hypothetical protein BKA70DRAFT_1407387 [Coprinopsis sp. MPI-PUGE-AT-0042]|nr:hypothetical protein BKA70DRAFT_1407387 [Coprinopsis sp. MPI-PUGE-AT-0042]